METTYVKNPLISAITVKGIYTIHYFKYGKNFHFPNERHNFWEMVYVDGGEAHIIADGTETILHQGEAVFHAPNVSHTIFTEDDFANAAIISFESSSRPTKQLKNRIFTFGEKEKKLLNEIITEGSLTYAEKLNDPNLSKMNKRAEAPFGSEQIIKNNIENLIIRLIRSTFDSEAAPAKNSGSIKTEEIAERIIAILKANVYSNVTLEEISKELYFSKTYIKNIFKNYTGSSIIHYYIDLKIEEAKKLISYNKYSFTEIADKLCINSVHYFSRLFKQRTDMNPTEYAKCIKVDNLII